MTYTKIKELQDLARHWGGRKALNWTVLAGCPESARRQASICAVSRLSACWAESISGHGFDEIRFFPGALDEPKSRAKSAVILVAWRSEIADAPQDKLMQIIEVIRACPYHVFVMLTKKAKQLGQKLESLRGNFPQNLLIGVSICVQQDLYRLRELEIYLSGLGAYFSFAEPVLGFWNARAVLEALHDCPSIQVFFIGGWSDLTPDTVKNNNPIHPDSVRAIVGATYEYEIISKRHIALIYKDNCPLGVSEGYKSDYPLIPGWLKQYGMFETEDEGEQTTTTEQASSEPSKQGSQASMF